MKKVFLVIIFCIILQPITAFRFGKQPSSPDKEPKEKELFQVSTINALMEGVFDGDYTYGNLMKKGNYGIGTFNDVDGEMIALDGNFYQVRYDGKVTLVDSSQVTPFAQVVFFKPTSKFKLTNQSSFQNAARRISSEFLNKNIPYAVFLKGEFSWVKVRTLQAQKKPYPSFLSVTESQKEFTRQNVKGMVFGFWFPDYWSGVSVPGFHLHFLSEDHKFGGHIENMALSDVSVSIQPIYEYQIHLPDVKNFAEAKLNRNMKTEILEAESSPGMSRP